MVIKTIFLRYKTVIQAVKYIISIYYIPPALVATIVSINGSMDRISTVV